MRKKLLKAVLAAAMLLGLTACGGKEPSEIKTIKITPATTISYNDSEEITTFSDTSAEGLKTTNVTQTTDITYVSTKITSPSTDISSISLKTTKTLPAETEITTSVSTEQTISTTTATPQKPRKNHVIETFYKYYKSNDYNNPYIKGVYSNKGEVHNDNEVWYSFNDFIIKLKFEQSFSGDKRYLGIYSTIDNNWILPYTTDVELPLDYLWSYYNAVLDGDEVYIKCYNNYILEFYNKNRVYYYNMKKDKCIKIETGLDLVDIKGEKLFFSNFYTTLEGVYWCDFSLNDYRYSDSKLNVICDKNLLCILPDAFIAGEEISVFIGFENIKVYDYNGNVKITIPDVYNVYTKKGGYNGEYVLFAAQGEDSGAYAVLLDSNGKKVIEPIKLDVKEYNDINKIHLSLFNDFFTIVQHDTVYIYELNGELITQKTLTE